MPELVTLHVDFKNLEALVAAGVIQHMLDVPGFGFGHGRNHIVCIVAVICPLAGRSGSTKRTVNLLPQA